MKFKLHEKLKYMFLGGVLTLAGFMFGNMNSDTEAQFGSETIDKLTVRELNVHKNITLVDNNMNPRVLISWDRDGGKVTVYGPWGKGSAGLAVDENGGKVTAHGIRGKGAAGFTINEDGGAVTVQGVIGETGASLSATQEGGSVAVFNPQGNPRAAFSVVNGNGVVYVVDRFGEFRVLEP